MKMRITESQFNKSYERLTENELGTKFEQAIVDVATGIDSDISQLPWSASAADKKRGEGTTLAGLASKALANMGIEPNSLSAEEAYVFSDTPEQGGDPKTDIVIDGKKISVKLPKGIQLASGEAASTLNALKPHIEKYLDSGAVEKAIKDRIKKSWLKLYKGLNKTAGKRYISSDPERRELELRKAAERRAKDPKKAKGRTAEEIYDDLSLQLARKMAEGLLIPSWEEWNEKEKPRIKRAFADVLFTDENLSNIIVYELLTGKQQFADEPEMAADYMLSPDGFYDLSTMKKAIPYINKVRKAIMADVRGKGRPLASKAVAARIDMDASEIYEKEIVDYFADQLGFLDDENLKKEFLLSNPDIYKASLYQNDGE